MEEIKSLRTERNKVFNLGGNKCRLVCHCKPIHYKSKGKNSWDEINLDFQDDNKGNFITDKNKISIGFRKDKKLYKYFGARYDYEHQFESTIKEIVLDNVEQVKSDKFIGIQKKSKVEIDLQINSEIEIVNKINEVSLVNFVKVNNPIEDFKLVEELHLKGLKCSNKKTGKKYVVDKFGRFNFIDENGELKFWINKPFFIDNTEETSQNIIHTLEEIDGKLIYTKTPIKEGRDDLVLAIYPILIDTNTYYSTTADGYVEHTGTTSWAATRSDATGDSAVSNGLNYSAAMYARHQSKASDWTIVRSFFYFDTQDLPDEATITGAVLKLYGITNADSDVSAQKGTQAASLTTADFDSFSGSEYGHVTWGIVYKSITFNATGKSEIVKDGTTKICCREYTHDYSDSAPSDTTYSNGCYYADKADITYDPKLEIDYTEGVAENKSKRLLRGIGI